jgi:phenylacetate-CoA ligase
VLDNRACACGRGLPLLAEVQGRTTDFVVAADGTVMHGLALIYSVREEPGIERFKIVQESLARTRILVVPSPAFDPAAVQRIRAAFKRRLGEQVDVSVEVVDDSPPEPSGKHRYVVSRVAA